MSELNIHAFDETVKRLVATGTMGEVYDLALYLLGEMRAGNRVAFRAYRQLQAELEAVIGPGAKSLLP